MQNPAALKRLVAGGTQLRPFTNEVLEACLKATNELWARNLRQECRLQEVDRCDAGLPLRPVSVVAGRRIHLRQLHDPLAHARLIVRYALSRRPESPASRRRPGFLRCGTDSSRWKSRTGCSMLARKPRHEGWHDTQSPREEFNETTRLSQGHRIGRRGRRDDRRAGDRAIDAGDQMAHADELAEIARHALWRRRDDGQGGRRSHRQQIPDPDRSPPAKSCRACRSLDAVQNGTVEIGHTASYYYFGKDPTFAFGTSVPFGPNMRLNQAWYMLGGGKEVLNEFYKKYNCHRRCSPATPAARWAAGSARRSTRVDDLKGLKMRIGGFAGTRDAEARRRAAADRRRRHLSGAGKRHDRRRRMGRSLRRREARLLQGRAALLLSRLVGRRLDAAGLRQSRQVERAAEILSEPSSSRPVTTPTTG